MKKIKLLTILVLSVIMAFSTFVTSFAEETTYVYVTISAGDLKVAAEKIALTDADSDGVLTINDALYLAHEAQYVGGAKKGFASSMGAFGLKIDMLWGYEAGDSYGYYVNNASAMSLGDVLKNGDYVYAFVYQDLEAWSDTYSFFETAEKQVEVAKEFTLQLSSSGFDEMWNPIKSPVQNATIMLNGMPTDFKTNENGEAIITIEEAGTYIISAKSDYLNLVPPVCKVFVTQSEIPNTSEETSNTESENIPTESPSDVGYSFYFILLILSLISIIVIKQRKNYEV